MRVNISIAITKMVRDPNPANDTSDNNQNEMVLRNGTTYYMNRIDDNDTQNIQTVDGNIEIDLINIEQYEAFSVSRYI